MPQIKFGNRAAKNMPGWRAGLPVEQREHRVRPAGRIACSMNVCLYIDYPCSKEKQGIASSQQGILLSGIM